jgi:hypothetical protein
LTSREATAQVDRCGDQRYRNLIGAAGGKRLSCEQEIQGRKTGDVRPKITTCQCCINVSPYNTPVANSPFDIYGKVKKDIKREYYEINSVIFLSSGLIFHSPQMIS